ncbi:MAG TPA: hypothetical protein VFF30_09220 [Nitrososphaerales archaeon]|nr:hypothetical protein [Nitrososphaerales archaeon]
MTMLISEKRPEVKSSAATTTTPQASNVPMAKIGHQMTAFGNTIREYLEKVDANVENYKFSVAKHGDGLDVELELKVLVQPKSVSKTG